MPDGTEERDRNAGTGMLLDLTGKWKISDDGGRYAFTGNVPGTVQGDLVRLGLVPHPYVGLNEAALRDLEQRSWTYVRTFDLDEVPAEENVELVCEGIDTLAEVQLNGIPLGTTGDMFLTYRFDVRKALTKGRNILQVHIQSPVREAADLERIYGKRGATDESIRAYIRKAQYAYGWDWGIRLPTSGIWRPVTLVSYRRARLTGCTASLEERHDDGTGTVRVRGEIVPGADFGDARDYGVTVRVDDTPAGTFPVTHAGDELRFEGTFPLRDIRLWFPNGLGEHPLYAFTFTLQERDVPVCSVSRRIGLRTVALLRERDAEGASFIFSINGRRVFAKGANWIPADSVLSWRHPGDDDRLLRMARDAQMNMLRVWGGGIYEDDHFYTLCDELGIMVWQDFMFACAEYPDHLAWFRQLSDREVRETVRNLRSHASIVLWCGNNENNFGFDEWPMMGHKVDGEYLGNRLYLHDFPAICAREDPSRPYWPSSPYGGDRANAAGEGDRHVWNVWSGWEDYRAYAGEDGRFISEFGFQSAPCARTIDFFATREEQSIFSPVILSHNKKAEGQERILHFIDAHFGPTDDFAAFVYLSQLDQAEAIKFGVEHWRARKYRTAGTLYWQFNDSWPVFSWSSVDYFRRPKALYYYARRFYADILPVVRCAPQEHTASLLIVNDRPGDTDATVLLEAWNSDGTKIREKDLGDCRLPGDAVATIGTMRTDEFSAGALTDIVLHVRVLCGRQCYDNYARFGEFREMHLLDPGLSFSREGDDLTIRCTRPAFGVHIATGDDRPPADDFLTLVPSVTAHVHCPADRIHITSLYDYLKKDREEGAPGEDAQQRRGG